ncbi:MAG: hypothetical protein ACFE9T_06105 [Promethearchaeota archaeon]
MTTESFFGEYGQEIRRIIDLLNCIIDELEGFRENYTKKFNFSKLMDYLSVPKSEIDQIIYLILNFQDKFNGVFNNYLLKKKVVDGKLYLVTEEKPKVQLIPCKIPKIIRIKKSHINMLSDIIYVFKYVKRGKGFTIDSNCFDLLNKLKELNKQYPYFFKIYQNGLVYPSKFGIKLGDLVLSFNKSNKELTNLNLDNNIIEVISDE